MTLIDQINQKIARIAHQIIECNIDEKEVIIAGTNLEINEINKSDTIARSMGINGVPFFEINNKTYISGAQSGTNLIEAIKANL